MKRKLAQILLLLLVVLLSSCAVINSLLGYNECNYPNCDRNCVDNCNYCSFHCDSYSVPDDLTSKAGKSIDQQLKQHREDQKKK